MARQDINWRFNLVIAWLGSFFTGASFSLVMPFMALYVEELDAPSDKVALYAGLAVALSALASALVSPIWGRLADRYGRKPMMVRASFAMTVTMGGLAFVPNVYWLLLLRILNGLFAGYVPNATALIASQAPKEHSGYALGTLATGVTAGSLIGPLLGGLLAQWLGIRNVFLVVGALLLLCSLLTLVAIKEDVNVTEAKDVMPTRDVFREVSNRHILVGLFVTSMIIYLSAQSISPIFPLYVRHLGQRDHLIFTSGLIVSAMVFSSMLSSSSLGKLGDRIGNHRLLLLALAYSFIMYLCCGLARTPLQLAILRFYYGFGTGALMPSVNSLLSKMSPKEGISRIFSYNQTFSYLGQVLGPMVGSSVANGFGYRSVFFVTAAIVCCNLIWSLLNFRHYLTVREIT
ncbi:MFS transporter [Streptococcus sp. zg-JUN1979]|uniref:MFS transporter n=1 Tax=Streptococcus sp. zg-JUN1979 TaxID=3391450 RepID=UPI0039A59CE5